MKLLSLHQDYKYKAIVDALKSGIHFIIMIIVKMTVYFAAAKQPPAMFWTSGTDLECEGNFGYCTTNRLLRDEAKCVFYRKTLSIAKTVKIYSIELSTYYRQYLMILIGNRKNKLYYQ
jgi:hypothetical protein